MGNARPRGAGTARALVVAVASVTNDGQYVRAISRVGLGFLNPAGVVRLHNGA